MYFYEHELKRVLLELEFLFSRMKSRIRKIDDV